MRQKIFEFVFVIQTDYSTRYKKLFFVCWRYIFDLEIPETEIIYETHVKFLRSKIAISFS